MPSAHHSGVESLFDDFAAAGFDDRLAAHQRHALSLFRNVSPDSFSLFRAYQARFQMSMVDFGPISSGQPFVERHAPFLSQSLDPLARHSIHFMRLLPDYPVVSLSN